MSTSNYESSCTVAILSDTHGYLDDPLPPELASCDEIWHAGDIGTLEVAHRLATHRPLRAVHGNIDDPTIREYYPETLRFRVGGADVLMIHIAGKPKYYLPKVRKLLAVNPPQILVCGHTHLLRVLHDARYQMLYINPGAIGVYGIQQVRTFLRMHISEGKPSKLEVVELAVRYPV